MFTLTESRIPDILPWYNEVDHKTIKISTHTNSLRDIPVINRHICINGVCIKEPHCTAHRPNFGNLADAVFVDRSIYRPIEELDDGDKYFFGKPCRFVVSPRRGYTFSYNWLESDAGIGHGVEWDYSSKIQIEFWRSDRKHRAVRFK